MVLKNYDIFKIIELCNGKKKLYFFGAGEACIGFINMFQRYELPRFLLGIIDNNSANYDKVKIIGESKIPVISFSKAKNYLSEDCLIIITTKYLNEVMQQLSELPYGEAVFYGFIKDLYSDWKLHNGYMDCKIVQDFNYNIPKIIHYCWFGKNPIPEKYKVWMSSWKKFCPDYEIVEWNEDNYDYKKNEYMYEAYKAKKMGFVPDYARLDIVYNYGGIYLDTDVEIIQNFDKLLNQKAFAGFQDESSVSLGLGFGAIKNNSTIKLLRDAYEKIKFVTEEGKLNLIASPQYQTDTLMKKGLVCDGSFQQLEDLNVYPKVFFSSQNHYNGEIVTNANSFSIHHYDFSWGSSIERSNYHGLPAIYKQINTQSIENES